jgi:hypothetical protein
MRLFLAFIFLTSCFGQGKKNVVETGTINGVSSNRIPPTYTFASPPGSPPTGAVYVFTDASAAGVCSGGGSSLAPCRWSGSTWKPVSGVYRALVFVFDGGGAALTSGKTIYLRIPFACTVTDWSIMSTTAETVTAKLWRVAAGGTAIPTVSNSISTSGVSLSSGTAVLSTTLTDFTSTSIAANDLLAANLTAVTASQQVTYILGCNQ